LWWSQVDFDFLYFIDDDDVGSSYLCIGNMEWQIPTEELFIRGDTKRKLEKTGKKITKILEDRPKETEGEFKLPLGTAVSKGDTTNVLVGAKQMWKASRALRDIIVIVSRADGAVPMSLVLQALCESQCEQMRIMRELMLQVQYHHMAGGTALSKNFVQEASRMKVSDLEKRKMVREEITRISTEASAKATSESARATQDALRSLVAQARNKGQNPGGYQQLRGGGGDWGGGGRGGGGRGGGQLRENWKQPSENPQPKEQNGGKPN
jgi:hypothetical protein